MALIADGWLSEATVADDAHFERFDGILAHSAALTAIAAFQLLPLHIGEHRRRGIVFGVLAHRTLITIILRLANTS